MSLAMEKRRRTNTHTRGLLMMRLKLSLAANPDDVDDEGLPQRLQRRLWHPSLIIGDNDYSILFPDIDIPIRSRIARHARTSRAQHASVRQTPKVQNEEEMQISFAYANESEEKSEFYSFVSVSDRVTRTA